VDVIERRQAVIDAALSADLGWAALHEGDWRLARRAFAEARADVSRSAFLDVLRRIETAPPAA
jgi:hypothetical protein